MSSRPMRLKVEIDREKDGRWIAEVPELPGVLAYGPTREEAFRAASVLAYRVYADRVEHHEAEPADISFAFA